MSALSPHIRSHRALCGALEKQANHCETELGRAILGAMAEAHADAADELEAHDRELEARIASAKPGGSA